MHSPPLKSPTPVTPNQIPYHCRPHPLTYHCQMNWRESVDIMKAIIQFYTKAQAFEQLAGFYDSCAQVEIDDYRDYEKAIGALKEATKYLAKTVDSRNAKEFSTVIEQRIGLIERFVLARKAMQRDPETMVELCVALLAEPMLEDAIRTGDCLAMLVDYYHAQGNLREAFTYVREMEQRNIALHPYIDAQILEEVFRANGAREGKTKGEEKSERQVSGQTGQSSMPRGQAADDSGEESEGIEEDIGGESPVKAAPQRGYAAVKTTGGSGGGGGGGPSRGEAKSARDGRGSGAKRSAGAGAGAGGNGDESLDEEIDEEVDEDSPVKPVHKNRK